MHLSFDLFQVFTDATHGWMQFLWGSGSPSVVDRAVLKLVWFALLVCITYHLTLQCMGEYNVAA